MIGEDSIRVGIDVGGTFTDFVLIDSRTDRAVFGKELTTHDDPSRGMLGGLEKLLVSLHLSLSDLDAVVHATTLVTNAIIERKGARVGLVTTKGFRDTLEIGNETRYELYDLTFEKPEPLVPRWLRCEVGERVDASARIVAPLDTADVVSAADLLREQGVEAVAVCLLHSYRNPIHERRTRDILEQVLPGVPVTLSSDVAPVMREYERANTACANAYVQPLVARYLAELTSRLSRGGFEGPVQLMLSGGGLTTVAAARAQPIHLIESGPAAGAIAAGFFSKSAEAPHLISFDMGGTTAKICLLSDGEPQRSTEFEAARVQRFKKGSGLPLKVPVIDLIEIGAGGGSIAHLNSMGLLKVGPASAGSTPGPVCYGRGGAYPTVTDADLVLGYLSPDYFLGGELRLDLSSVHEAIGREIAGPLGLSIPEAAAGIHEVVNETMASATRMHLAEKGKDPGIHTLLAFGGAGPVHAYGLAKLLKIPRIAVPPGAGVTSALGLLVAAPAVDLARGNITRLASADWNTVNRLFAEMEDEARSLMAAAGVDWKDVNIVRSADMRFIGQGYEIASPLPAGRLSEQTCDRIELNFIEAYEELFGRRVTGVGTEALAWRLNASAPRKQVRVVFPGSHDAKAALKGTRKVFFPETDFVDCPVFDRSRLLPGTAISGPAIIEERESTTVVGPDAKLGVDDHLNLIIEIDHGGSDSGPGAIASSNGELK